MSHSTNQLLFIGLILLASSILQGSVGFAAGLFGIPLLMLLGKLTLPEAVAINLVAAAVQNGTAAGAWALYLVGNAGEGTARLVVGAIVLAIVGSQCVLRIQPQKSLSASWEWIAFILAGLLLGLCGMGGPQMVLWVMSHDWPIVRAKSFMFFIFATGMVPQAICMWLLFGWPILPATLLGLAGIPLVLLGTLLGLKIGCRLPDRIMRPVCMAALAAIGLMAVLSGLLP